jgi:hypothetical protein
MDGCECNYTKKWRKTVPTQVGIPFWKCPMKEKLLGKVPYNYTIKSTQVFMNIVWENQKVSSLHLYQFLWVMWIWNHLNGMEFHPWKRIKFKDEIKLIQKISSIILFCPWCGSFTIIFFAWKVIFLGMDLIFFLVGSFLCSYN